eukprot:gene27455-4758_t
MEPSLPAPFSPVKVYQDYSIRASRSLNNDLELVREWMDNSMAPGSARNTPPDGLGLKITFDIVERNERRVLVYTDNGQSVPVQHLDNLLCYGHKDKICPVRAQTTSHTKDHECVTPLYPRDESTTPQHRNMVDPDAEPDLAPVPALTPDEAYTPEAAYKPGTCTIPEPNLASEPALAVYGEIGQGLPMTMTALAAISYHFFRQADGTTFVMAYGQAVIDPDGTTCRIVLALPNKEPKKVVLRDLMCPEGHNLGDRTSRGLYGAAVATSIGYFTKDLYKACGHGRVVTQSFLYPGGVDAKSKGIAGEMNIGYFTQDQYQAKNGGVLPLYSNLEDLMLRAQDVPTPGVLFDVMLMEGPRQGCELGAYIRPALQEKDVAPSAHSHHRSSRAPHHPHLQPAVCICHYRPPFPPSPPLTSPPRLPIAAHLTFRPAVDASDEPVIVDDEGYQEKNVKYWLSLNNILIYVMLDREMLHRMKLLRTPG